MDPYLRKKDWLRGPGRSGRDVRSEEPVRGCSVRSVRALLAFAGLLCDRGSDAGHAGCAFAAGATLSAGARFVAVFVLSPFISRLCGACYRRVGRWTKRLLARVSVERHGFQPLFGCACVRKDAQALVAQRFTAWGRSSGSERSTRNWYGPGESDCLIKTKHRVAGRPVQTRCDFCPVL